MLCSRRLLTVCITAVSVNDDDDEDRLSLGLLTSELVAMTAASIQGEVRVDACDRMKLLDCGEQNQNQSWIDLPLDSEAGSVSTSLLRAAADRTVCSHRLEEQRSVLPLCGRDDAGEQRQRAPGQGTARPQVTGDNLLVQTQLAGDAVQRFGIQIQDGDGGGEGLRSEVPEMLLRREAGGGRGGLTTRRKVSWRQQLKHHKITVFKDELITQPETHPGPHWLSSIKKTEIT